MSGGDWDWLRMRVFLISLYNSKDAPRVILSISIWNCHCFSNIQLQCLGTLQSFAWSIQITFSYKCPPFMLCWELFASRQIPLMQKIMNSPQFLSRIVGWSIYLDDLSVQTWMSGQIQFHFVDFGLALWGIINLV